MNLLLDELPTAVTVGGVSVPIRSDFRPALRTVQAFEDNELTPQEKNEVALRNLYEEVPQPVDEALERALWFLSGGQAAADDETARLYSVKKDANLIYSAFRQTHGVDLGTASLHWWVFLALFMDLGSETFFCSLVGLRKRVRDGSATKEEREVAHELGELFDVPELDTRTLEEKELEANFMRRLGARRT